MKITKTRLKGVLILEPRRFEDERGFFSETYNQVSWAQLGIETNWVQDNHSKSSKAGVIRGLHWQHPPFAQAKLVRVTRGAIYDVAVDLRQGSPTYGDHVGVELSEQNWLQLLVPIGFAHGFCTLSDDCEVLYKTSAPYNSKAESGLSWCDTKLAINWPLAGSAPTLSDRDMQWGALETLDSPFEFDC